MKFNRYLLGIVTTLSVCLGQGDDSIFSNAATVRTAMRFAVEVPFNNIAMNTVPDGLTTHQSIAHILKQKGVRGFYSGSPIELLRSVLWYPRMQLMNDPWKVCVPVGSFQATQEGESTREFNINWVEYAPYVSTAANLAGFEMIVMPLFRVRSALMLHPMKSVIESAPHIIDSLYAGSILRGGTTFASWAAFFKAQEYAKDHWENYPLAQAAFIMGTQMLVGAATAPLYVVMINRQKLTNPCDLPLFASAWETYLKQGSHVFIRSAKFGAAHAGVQAALTVGVLKLCGEK